MNTQSFSIDHLLVLIIFFTGLLIDNSLAPPPPLFFGGGGLFRFIYNRKERRKKILTDPNFEKDVTGNTFFLGLTLSTSHILECDILFV
jgi:hypothetical protein